MAVVKRLVLVHAGAGAVAPAWVDRDVCEGPAIDREIVVVPGPGSCGAAITDKTDLLHALPPERRSTARGYIGMVARGEFDAVRLTVHDAGEMSEWQYEWATYATVRTPRRAS